MHKLLLMILIVGQILLTIIFGIGTVVFFELRGYVRETEENCAGDFRNLERYSGKIAAGLNATSRKLRDTSGALKKIGYGDDIISCVDNIEEYANTASDIKKKLGRIAELLEKRYSSCSCFILMMLCAVMTSVFFASTVGLFLIRRDFYLPDHRQ